MLRFARLIVIVALGFAGRSAAIAQQAPATRPIGLARVDVTPEYPTRMSGYFGRNKEFEAVEQRLWAKALAIGDSQPAVLITVDNLGIPNSMTDEVARRLADEGVTRERLVICASHTHCGPALLAVAPLILNDLKEAERKHLDQYALDLTNKLEQAARNALADRAPARLAWSQGSVDFAVNRRRIKDGKVSFGMTPAPAGRVDHALPVLRVTDPDGKLRGILVNYACHCTTLGGLFNRICGDWAGYAQEIFEREHPGAIAMVSIGCGADANPQPRDDLLYARLHGQSIVHEVDRLLAAAWKPIDGKLTARLERFELPFDTLPSKKEFAERAKQGGPIALHARANLDRLERGEKLPQTLPYQVATWSFDDELAMVFLAGEVVVDYTLRLKQIYDPNRLWVTAYANDEPCYIASKRVLAEGGYEVDSSMYYYDRPTHFVPAIEDQIISAVERMLPAGFRRAAGPVSKAAPSGTVPRR